MKIDLGPFGNRVPERGPTVVVDNAAAGVGVGLAIQNAGIASMNLAAGEVDRQRAEADRLRREQIAEQKRVESERSRALATEAHATFQNDAAEISEQVSEGVRNGTIRREDAAKAYTDQVEARRAALVDTVPPEHREITSAGMVRTQGVGLAGVARSVRVADREQRAAAIEGTLEQYQRLAVRDPQAAIAQADLLLKTEGPGVYGADKVGARRQAFKENALLLNANQRIVDAGDNPRALTAIEKDIRGDAYNDMDPAKRTALLGSIENARARFQARADAAENRRLAGLQAGWSNFYQAAQSGFPVDPKAASDLLTASKGTVFEKMGEGIVKDANFISTFAVAPPLAQARIINETEAALRTKGVSDPASIQRLEKLRQIHNDTKELLSKDVQTYAIRTGRSTMSSLDFSEQGLLTLGSQVQERLRVARGLAREFGTPLQVFTADEAKQVGSLLEKVGPETRAGLLQQITRGIGDSQAAGDTMKQLAANGYAITARAGYVATRRGLMTDGSMGSGPAISMPGDKSAALLLRGDAIMRGGKDAPKVDMPPAEKFDALFESSTRGAFKGPGTALARQEFLNYAVRYYAALSEEEGKYDSKNIDGARWNRAVELATGGIGTRGGQKFILPYGVSHAQFSELFTREYARAFEDGRADVPPAVAINLPLAPAGDGKYFIRNGTDFVRANPAGAGAPPEGMIEKPTIDLRSRPKVTNADGSISTVRSITVGMDGREYVLPTVVGGRIVSNEDAIAEFRRTGQHLGVFKTPAAAEAYAEKLHKGQAAWYAGGSDPLIIDLSGVGSQYLTPTPPVLAPKPPPAPPPTDAPPTKRPRIR